MALTKEDLTAIAEQTEKLLEPLTDDVRGMKADMNGMKADMNDMRSDIKRLDGTVQSLSDKVDELDGTVQSLTDKVDELDETVQSLSGKVSRLAIHVENETDHNIQLLAENHLDLVEKLNQSISVQNKNLLFEVEISGLKSRASRLEEQVFGHSVV